MNSQTTGQGQTTAATSSGQGERHLAAGEHIAMRKWEREQPGEPKPASRRDYETLGYVLEGRAELHLGGKVTTLEPGASWVVPHGTEHTYRILETFSAIEVTHPSYRAD